MMIGGPTGIKADKDRVGCCLSAHERWWQQARHDDRGLVYGRNTIRGNVTHRGVADARGRTSCLWLSIPSA